MCQHHVTAGYPLLDNILAPTAAGSSNISSSFAAALSRRFSLTVKDTYQQAWPAAAPLSDTSARVDANMSNAAMLVTYLMVPSAQLDVWASPPVMPGLSEVQAGVFCCRVWGSLRGLHPVGTQAGVLGTASHRQAQPVVAKGHCHKWYGDHCTAIASQESVYWSTKLLCIAYFRQCCTFALADDIAGAAVCHSPQVSAL
jgi:hypothetical protein